MAWPPRASARTGRRSPNEDEGGVVSGPRGIWKPDAGSTATSTVFHRHARTWGNVNWNDADKARECPLHGSRFAPDGTLLEGPATRDLTASLWG